MKDVWQKARQVCVVEEALRGATREKADYCCPTNRNKQLFSQGLELCLKDDASVIDTIEAVDMEIKRKSPAFPVRNRRSLLQMVYLSSENRFYKQAAIQASSKDERFLNVRENRKCLCRMTPW